MRILKVRFANLNSLAGEWEIDFTHKFFRENGIFAITGPTGAGKSTILDAICLALYGETPRLSKVNKSANEIMSRRTAACFAEVQFETNKGSFRCHWSQRRARNKLEGELQAPKHEISDAGVQGKVLESSLSGVKAMVESVTGMDFKRFTRSMLLAQGGFDAFLKADTNERSAILEQITGTDIYSRISIEVFQRRNSERDMLANLQGMVNAYQVLSQEELNVFQNNLLDLNTQASQLNGNLKETLSLLAWQQNIQRLNREITDNETKLSAVQDKLLAFAPSQELLSQARKTLPQLGAYRSLQELNSRLHELRNEQAAYVCQSSALAKDIKATQDSLAQQQEVLNLAEQEDQKLQPLFRQVRELDTIITEQQSSLTALQEDKSPIENALQSIETEIMETNAKLGSAESQLAQSKKFLEENPAAAELVESFSAISARLKQLGIQEAELEKGNKKLKDAQSATFTEELHKASAQVQSLRAEQEVLSNKIAELKDSQTELLATNELAHYRKALQESNLRSTKLIDLQNSLLAQADSRTAMLKTQKLLAECRELAAKLSAEIAQLSIELQATEQSLEDKRSLYLLSEKIQSLEEERKQLRQNTPCPLCGSLSHPYTDSLLPTSEISSSDLDELTKRLKDMRKKLQGREKHYTEASTGLQFYTEQLQDQENKDADILQNLHRQCSSLAIATEMLTITEVAALLATNTAENLHLNNLISTAEGLAGQINTLEKDFNHKNSVLPELLLVKQSLENKEQLRLLEQEHLNQQVNELADSLFAEKQALQKLLAPYQVTLSALNKPETLINKLQKVRSNWLQQQQQERDISAELARLQGVLHSKQATEQGIRSQIEAIQYRLNILQKQVELKLEQRIQLFGQKAVLQEEQIWAKNLSAKHNKLQELRLELQKQSARLQGIDENSQRTEQQISKVSQQYQLDLEQFTSAIKAIGLSTLAAFEAAILSPEIIAELAKQEEALISEQQRLQSLNQENRLNLNAETQKQLTPLSLEELLQAYSDLQENIASLNRQTGTIEARLIEDKAQKNAQAEQYKLIDQQKQELLRWDRLNELIGSADGKKYRTFVQGITFEMLITHANVQLNKLSDRYLLINSFTDPLDLNIIDAYQGGEVRTIKNLSGGESFIVSLALALGLSSMSSKNVRIDSLFLDEGFGSLDEDALESALENLAALNSQGKLIGLISHVPALKERITTQIQISPRSGGISTISGAGCRALDT